MEIINSEEMKRLRIQHGLTQGDVAARLKIAEATVSRYEAEIIKKASRLFLSVILNYLTSLSVHYTKMPVRNGFRLWKKQDYKTLV